MTNEQEQTQSKTTAMRHYGKLVAVVVLGVLIGAALTATLHNEIDTSGYTQLGTGTSTIEVVQTEVATPVTLRIPAIDLATTFEGPLGLNADQTIEVPESYEEVGWYRFGPRPGELGPAVVLGHVDSYEGPAVFYKLNQLREGDVIEIARTDGSVAVFQVTRLLHRAQSDFPTKEVYSDIDHAGLRLITCSGTYDRGRQAYSHNLIVFGELLEVRQ